MAHKLLPGEQLLPKQSLESRNGRYRLIYQGDGNLVILDLNVRGGKPIWNSGTAGSAPGILKMQDDGNLVLYNQAGAALWNTETWLPHQRGIFASLQDDGHLTVHVVTPGWSSALPHPHRVPVAKASSNGVSLKKVSGVSADTVQVVVALL